MPDTLTRVKELVGRGEVRISLHGYDELAADGISAREVMAGLEPAIVVEDYRDYPKGPCVLALQHDTRGDPIHVVWGIPAGEAAPAVLVTAYRPNPEVWDETYTRRVT